MNLEIVDLLEKAIYKLHKLQKGDLDYQLQQANIFAYIDSLKEMIRENQTRIEQDKRKLKTLKKDIKDVLRSNTLQFNDAITTKPAHLSPCILLCCTGAAQHYTLGWYSEASGWWGTDNFALPKVQGYIDLSYINNQQGTLRRYWRASH